MSTSIHGRKVEVSRRTWLMIAALAIAVAIPPWFLMYALYHFSPNFQLAQRKALERPDDPNWRVVSALGESAWKLPSPVIYSTLNGGDWKALCVNGGNTDPIATFAGTFEGVSPSEELRARFDRPMPVDDYDLAVSFADRAGNVDILYLVGGGSLLSKGLVWCTAH